MNPRWPLPIIAIALAGLGASILVHLTAAVGLPNPFGRAAWGLHGGIFVVGLPTFLAARRMPRPVDRKDFWRVLLRGCPSWAMRGLYGLFAYAIVNFLLFAAGLLGDANDEAVKLRGFSGHWMVFYAAAAAALHSVAHAAEHDETRRCANAHPASPLAKYCEECGAPVVTSVSAIGSFPPR